MCMKYVNANIAIFENITKVNEEVRGLLNPFDCLRAEECDDGLYISNFNILTYVNVMGSTSEENNLFNYTDKLNIKIRFTKCTPKDSERLSIDLDEFNIDLNDSNGVIRGACVPFVSYKRITPIKRILLDVTNPKGNYAIKVLVKLPTDDKYVVQSIYRLTVE